LAKFIGPWAPTEGADFLTQVFVANEAIIQVFRAFDWPSSVSGSKVMAKSHNFDKKSILHIFHSICSALLNTKSAHLIQSVIS